MALGIRTCLEAQTRELEMQLEVGSYNTWAEALIYELPSCSLTTLQVLADALRCPSSRLGCAATQRELDELCNLCSSAWLSFASIKSNTSSSAHSLCAVVASFQLEDPDALA